jgi:hypothetical protein
MCLDFGGTNPTGFILTTVLGTAASEARINQNQSNNQNNLSGTAGPSHKSSVADVAMTYGQRAT